jgi:hypothetical protein
MVCVAMRVKRKMGCGWRLMADDEQALVARIAADDQEALRILYRKEARKPPA